MRARQQRCICTHSNRGGSSRERLAEYVFKACTEVAITLQQNVAY
jgi:hypothetical protein